MIIIDVEIKKAIPNRNEPPLPDIEYCGGWRDFAGMGIACVCTYDIVSHLSRTFLEEDLVALFEYLRDRSTAGFNTKRFDIPLLMHHWLALGLAKDRDSIGCPHYDMLEEIWLALGINPDKFVPATHGGWSLDAVCQATLGIAKTGNGALAPVWWQQGKRGKVIDYCLNDVWMEGQLLLHILRNGVITAFNKHNSVRVRAPQFLTEEQREAVERSRKCAQESPDRRYLRADGTHTVAGPGFNERYPAQESIDEPPAAPAERSPGGLGIVR